MALTAKSFEELIQKQELEKIENNALIVMALATQTEKPILMKKSFDLLSLPAVTIQEFSTIYKDLKIFPKKTTDLLLKSISVKDKKIKEIKDYTEEAQSVVDNLNSLTGKRSKLTNTRKTSIEKWLKEGYTVDQFFNVNAFFFFKWGSDPSQAEYVRSETLYNTKFPERVEQATEAFEVIKDYQGEIQNVAKFFNDIYSPEDRKALEEGDLQTTQHISFDAKQKISFWLSKGYTFEDVEIVIQESVNSWSKKPELLPYICLEKIMDRKFPERARVAKSRKKVLLNTKTTEEELNEWATD